MKNCSKCKREKEDEAFHRSKARGLQAVCKECRKTTDAIYWKERAADPVKLAAKRIYNQQRLEKRQKFMIEYLLQHPCVDCGETDIVVLTFDHVRGVKEFDISNGFRAGYSTERLATEIAKCDVRCANCHMRKTARDFNWYTFKYLQNCSQV